MNVIVQALFTLYFTLNLVDVEMFCDEIEAINSGKFENVNWMRTSSAKDSIFVSIK